MTKKYKKQETKEITIEATDILLDGRKMPDKKPARLTFVANPENNYSGIDWRDENNQIICRMTAHEHAHQNKNGERRIDKHFTLYTADDKGKLHGRIEIPYGRDRGQVQIENGPLVLKDIGQGIIMRSDNGKAWCIKVTDGGGIIAEPLKSDAIIKTEKPK